MSALERLRDWTRRGDLEAAAELFGEAQRRGARADARLALEVLLASGQWLIEQHDAEPSRTRSRRMSDHAVVAGGTMVAAATRVGGPHPAAPVAAELVLTTVREVLEPSTLNDCTRLWENPVSLTTRARDADAVLAVVRASRLEHPVAERPVQRMRDAIALAEHRLRAWREQVWREVPRAVDLHFHLDVLWFAGAQLVVGHLGGGTVLEVSDQLGVATHTRRHDLLRNPMRRPVATATRVGRRGQYPDALTGLLGAADSEPPDVFEMSLRVGATYLAVHPMQTAPRGVEAAVRESVEASCHGSSLCSRIARLVQRDARQVTPAVASLALVRHAETMRRESDDDQHT